MSKAHSKRSPRGFTLVELMIVVAIIGILASIAVPTFLRFQIRTKVSERKLVLHRFKQALDDKITREGRLAPESSGGFIWGTYTPPWPPSPTKRVANFKQVGWRELDMDIEGNCYYSYLFMAQSWATGNWGYIVAYGDLDADGRFSQKSQQYQTDWASGVFKLTWEWPALGLEDDAGPDRTF